MRESDPRPPGSIMATAPVLPFHHNIPVTKPTDISFTAKQTNIASTLREALSLVIVLKLWNACTTTDRGSLSETFKLNSSNSAPTVSSGDRRLPPLNDDAAVLDVVVVDEEDPHSQGKASPTSSLHGPESQNGSHFAADPANSYHSSHGFYPFIRFKALPAIARFFDPKFQEDETAYLDQSWYAAKPLAFCASLYLIVNWILYLVLNLSSIRHSIYAEAVFYGGLSLVTLPTPVMIALDMPRKSPVIFQVWFAIAVWYCAFAELIQTKQCHFFSANNNQCFGKDFLSMTYYATGLPALMMFIVSKRLYNFIAQCLFFVLSMVLIVPEQHFFIRTVISFVIFSIFMQGIHFAREESHRCIFQQAMQLKQAYLSKHKAQLAESNAIFTKRRFANYIFHEVRVPLNNAVLAFQLLQAGKGFKKDFEDGTEVYALEHGLNMMKTVLNDVLDFEKMDSGHFENNARPFPLHQSIRAILGQIEVQTDSRHLVLVKDLDERIDHLRLPAPFSDEGLWVVGSELRLHQILTNLASNAVKYTPSGGGAIQITTKLLGVFEAEDELPGTPPDIDDDKDGSDQDLLEFTPSPPKLCLKFRLEVQDSGPGIKTSDYVQDRLFMPFVQTSVGRDSGSGTGLGLAIVKQIVKMSGGRLGVISRPGEGAKFWIELSYPIASPAEVRAARETDAMAVPRTNPQFPYGGDQEEEMSGFVSGPLIESMTTVPSPPSPEREKYWPGRPFPPHESFPQVQPPPGLPSHPRETSPISAEPVERPLAVLVVDDDTLTCMLSSRLLKKLGCIVDTAKDGRECLHMLLAPDARSYDLICLDNFMPELTGEETVRELRAKGRKDFVVGCTGNALTEDQKKYLNAGADEVLTKPVTIHDFKRLLELAQQRRKRSPNSLS
ncbi:hypothetical protein C8J56DRAFT_363862 [Mycena floridula]|nr:hypothetical protein C8J56DRAFT_363862 [Mycena floridula]